jgi:hypothetical protein
MFQTKRRNEIDVLMEEAIGHPPILPQQGGWEKK